MRLGGAGHRGLLVRRGASDRVVPPPVQRLCHRTCVAVGAGRRVRGAKADGEEDAAKPTKRKPSSMPKKRGPKPTTSGDTVQLLDPAVLEEFRAQAAREEAERQAKPVDVEEDPARFNFHRVLMNAAGRGLPDLAESEIAQMREAGLPPGPRAYHALVFAYVRAKLPYEALGVAERVVKEGVLLLPETFVILIFSLLNHADPPDVVAAQQVLESMEAQVRVMSDAGASDRPLSAQSGWLMLCKELFRKGFIAEAMTTVKRGYDTEGYVADADLAAYVIEQLARAGLKDRAYQELQALESQGYRPGPQHYNPIIKAEAATGAWRRARYFILDAFKKPTLYPPNADTMTALFEGMVLSVDPVTGLPTGDGVATDDSTRLGDVSGSIQSEQGVETAGEDTATGTSSLLASQFTRVREELLLHGLRPSPAAYAAMCSGHIKMRATDEALGAFQAMCDAGGTTMLLTKKRLSALLLILAEEDRPADLLNILKSLASFNQPLPTQAMTTLDGLTPGCTVAAAWLPAHFEYMRAHPDDGTGRGSMGTAADSVRAMMQSAREVEVFNDVELSVLGGCAVEDDGSGVWVKPSRMTLPQLRAELTYAGVPYDEETAKRKELSALVKARREAMSKTVKDIQNHLEQIRKAGIEAEEARTGTLDLSKKKKGKTEYKQFRVVEITNGKLTDEKIVLQETKKRKAGFTVERMGSDPYDADDALSSERGEGGGDEDTDELADIIREGVDEGMADILRDEDTIFGDSGPESLGGPLDDTASMGITIDHIEARMLNRTAGMRLAYEVLRCVELLGGQPTGPDYEAHVAGVIAEGNADVALELSDRLPKLLGMGYSRDAVQGLYEQLARVCLNGLKPRHADIVLERAEDQGFEPDAALYAMLTRALDGQPRNRDRVKEEMADLVEDSATADILLAEDDDTDTSTAPTTAVSQEEGEEGVEGDEAEEGSSDGAVLDADAMDEEEDEEETGAYGRIPAVSTTQTSSSSTTGSTGEGTSGEGVSWEADGAGDQDYVPSVIDTHVPTLVQLLTNEDGTLDTSVLDPDTAYDMIDNERVALAITDLQLQGIDIEANPILLQPYSDADTDFATVAANAAAGGGDTEGLQGGSGQEGSEIGDEIQIPYEQAETLLEHDLLSGRYHTAFALANAGLVSDLAQATDGDTEGGPDGETDKIGLFGFTESEDGSVVLEDGTQLSAEQVDAIVSAVQEGKSPYEALVGAGLIDGGRVDMWQEQCRQILEFVDKRVRSELADEDEGYEDVLKDVDELLLSPETIGLVEGAKEKYAQLYSEYMAAVEAGDQEASESLASQLSSVQEELDSALQPTLTEFLDRGMGQARGEEIEREIDALINDEEAIAAVAREDFKRTMREGGIPINPRLMESYERSPTLVDMWQTEELQEIDRELASITDWDTMEEVLAALGVGAMGAMGVGEVVNGELEAEPMPQDEDEAEEQAELSPEEVDRLFKQQLPHIFPNWPTEPLVGAAGASSSTATATATEPAATPKRRGRSRKADTPSA